MKHRTSLLLISCALPLCLLGETAPPPPASFDAALTGGKVTLNVRARSESVSQTGLKDADALTLRTRLGYTTAVWEGLKASIEFENIASPDGDAYSQAGINPGGTGRAAVPDVPGSEVNQAWLAYTTGQTTATLGRQRLVWDNARFVGDSGWRQNAQTFDAFALQDKSLPQVTLNYAYLYRIDRVFGDRSPQGRWRSDSHLFNASYAGLPGVTLTGYAYLLDFDNAVASSCATYGLAATGATPLSKDVKLTYRAEYATQSDYGSSALNYSADYYTLEFGVSGKPGLLAAGYEVLGTDNNVGFKTPLGTLHAFNGWADLFLATPAAGLRDTYGKAGAALPGGVALLGFYHRFTTDTGADLGHEWDVQLTRKFGRYVTALVKYADFNRATTTLADVRKFWVSVEFAY